MRRVRAVRWTLAQARAAGFIAQAVGTPKPRRYRADWAEIGGKRNYYRSLWERNYAYYLEWLKQQGQIRDWQHEPKTFWFDGVRRGVVSYLPDFAVIVGDDSVIYHEVKGWMDPRSATKLRRMAKYHPTVRMHVVTKKQYTALKRSCAALVPGWQ